MESDFKNQLPLLHGPQPKFFIKRKGFERAGETAQLVKHLIHKHEDLS